MIVKSGPGQQRSAFLLRHLRTVILLTGITGFAWEVHAHPHAFIDAKVTVHFTKAKIARLGFTWLFDEDYSATLVAVFDVNKDGKLDTAESELFTEHMMKVLKTSHFFVDLLSGHKRWHSDAADKMAVQVTKEGRLQLTFHLILPQPQDPTETPFAVSVYDPTYYIEVAFDPTMPVRFTGDLDPGCSTKIETDQTNLIYFKSVAPSVLRLICRE